MDLGKLKKQLVVAAYERSLDWLEKIEKDIDVVVYRKGDRRSYDGEIVLPNNIGRCVHTFFLHIFNKFDDLADVTYFVQDYPFDHCRDLQDCLKCDLEQLKANNCAVWHGGYYGFDTLHTSSSSPFQHVGTGRGLVSYMDGCPSHCGLPLAEVWKRLFVSNTPPFFEFNPGGHFAITKEQIHKRSKQFYGLVVELLEKGCPDITNDVNLFPYCIERLENYIFNENFITVV